MTVAPLNPADIVQAKAVTIPDEVMTVWNFHIAKGFKQGKSRIVQDEIVLDIMSAMGSPRARVYTENWLDIEDVYRDAGWIVKYDKPGYCEDYPASFTFTKQKGDSNA